MRKGAVNAADSLIMRIGHRIKCRNRALLTQLRAEARDLEPSPQGHRERQAQA